MYSVKSNRYILEQDIRKGIYTSIDNLKKNAKRN